jgi:hypothetical protein
VVSTASHVIALIMSAGDAEGYFWRSCAATPDTCGQAMDVPDREEYVVSLNAHWEVREEQADTMADLFQRNT